jgi:hypothetical protein
MFMCYLLADVDADTSFMKCNNMKDMDHRGAEREKCRVCYQRSCKLFLSLSVERRKSASSLATIIINLNFHA